jgi:hypothetical protein
METEGMTTVATYGAEDAARDAAASLVSHGVGATVEPGGYGFCVAVLDSDLPRAHQVLGIEPPPAQTEVSEAEMTRSMRVWLVPVLLLGTALLVVPVIAFLVSFKLSGG